MAMLNNQMVILVYTMVDRTMVSTIFYGMYTMVLYIG